MSGARFAAIRAALDAMYFTGTHLVSRPVLGDLGAILMFHRVRPPRGDAFQPNRFLEISPQFLETVVTGMRARGIDVVSLDEAAERLAAGCSDRRFVALTFDDAYRDNREFAWPVLERLGAPFTLYVASDFADGVGKLWWSALEAAIAANDRFVLTVDGAEWSRPSRTPGEKNRAYADALALTGQRPGLSTAIVDQLAERHGVDAVELCRAACLDWDGLAEGLRSGLMTVGAHTLSHPILAHLSRDEVAREMSGSVARIEEKLGVRPRHFAYPHGGPNEAGPREFDIARELGFATAVTTRLDLLSPAYAGAMCRLPRITVNGLFQRMRYLDVLLSGVPTAVKKRFQPIAA